MTTISRLARQFKLSRSALLYYDRIGLLRPSGRSPSNYRLYTEADRQRLEAICRYRRIGLSLKTIGRILNASREGAGTALEQRLQAIEDQIQDLRRQQRHIRHLLGRASREEMAKGLNREKWTLLLRTSGMTEADMLQWHVEFERLFPGDHQLFLESLGIAPDEIDAIRTFSQTPKS